MSPQKANAFRKVSGNWLAQSIPSKAGPFPILRHREGNQSVGSSAAAHLPLEEPSGIPRDWIWWGSCALSVSSAWRMSRAI